MRIFPGMTFVHKLIGLSRSTMRKAALVVAATQIMLGSAPLTESDSRSTRAHVEAAGLDLHHAHNEETCIACVAFKVFGGARPGKGTQLVAEETSTVRSVVADNFDPRLASGSPRTRAPPATILG